MEKGTFQRRFESLLDSLVVLSGILILILSIINTYAVVMRYLFNSPIDWSLSASSVLMVWAVFLSGAYTLKADGHVFVNLVIMRVSDDNKTRLLLARHCIVFLFMIILTYHGYRLASQNVFSVAESIDRFPLFPGYIIVPLGGTLLCLFSAIQIAKLVKVLLK